jgi:hypothetical protein
MMAQCFHLHLQFCNVAPIEQQPEPNTAIDIVQLFRTEPYSFALASKKKPCRLDTGDWNHLIHS